MYDKIIAIAGMCAVFFFVIAIRDRIRVYKAKKEMEKYEEQQENAAPEKETPPEAKAASGKKKPKK